MDCKTALALLEPYLDNELDRADARELEAHVDSCIECRAALTRLGDIRVALRDNTLRYAAPKQLRDRLRTTEITDDMINDSSSKSNHRTRPPAWLRIAAACVLAFGAGGVSVHMWNSAHSAIDGSVQIQRDMFASHWRALAATSPVDVVSSDRHTVKPWFAGKLAVAPLVQDFADQGFPLVGGRLDYVGTERVAVLVYRHGQHLIDVFVLPPSASAAMSKPMELQGYALEAIMLGNQPAAIVSDMDQQELTRFGQLLGTLK